MVLNYSYLGVCVVFSSSLLEYHLLMDKYPVFQRILHN